MPVLSAEKKFQDFRRLLAELSEEHKISPEELAKAASLTIPLSLFSSGLTSLEIISKYLIENKKLSLSFAASLTGRSRQGIWQAYHGAKKKAHGAFEPVDSAHDVPLFFLTEGRRSALEAIVLYLKEHRMLSYADIGRLLHRDQRTVWTVYQRAKQK